MDNSGGACGLDADLRPASSGRTCITVAIRALNTALRHDWQVSRARNYLLLTPPFLLFAPKAAAAPGLLAGVVTHLAVLFLGWRYTRERPQTALKTLRLVRQQSASVRKARNQTRHGA